MKTKLDGSKTEDSQIAASETVCEQMAQGAISPEDAVKTHTENELVISKAYALDPNAIAFASPLVIATMVTKGMVSPQDAIYHNSYSLDVISAAYARDPLSIRDANQISVQDLMKAGIINPIHAVKICPDIPMIVRYAYKLDPNAIIFADESTIVSLISDFQLANPNQLTLKFPNAENVVSAAYSIVHHALNYASPTIVSALVAKGKVSPEHAIKAFPGDDNIIYAAYTQTPSAITYAFAYNILNLLIKGTVSPEDAVKAFPEYDEIIAQAYARDVSSIKYAFPTAIAALVSKGTVSPENAVKAFSDNEIVISAAYALKPDCFKQASPTTIAALIDKGTLSAKDTLMAFPTEEAIIVAACKKNPELLKSVSRDIIANLIDRKLISPEDAIHAFASAKDALMAFPKKEAIIIAVCRKNPALLKNVSTEIVTTLIDRNLISPEDAIKAFPSNEDIIEHAAHQDTLFVNTEDVLIHLINEARVDPKEAVKQCPNNIAIIEAAYNKDPTSIKEADRNAINQLGAAGIIKVQDVLNTFSKQAATEEEVDNISSELSSAIADKHWERVSEICHLFWFEKPAQATIEHVSQALSQNLEWEDLYALGQAYKTGDYELTEGPLIKSIETTQLEELYRKFLKEGLFDINNRNGDDYFVFRDGTEFNWTKIRAHADLQHVDLAPSDVEAYTDFITLTASETRTTLHEQDEDYYRTQLYTDPQSGEALERPDPPITFQEMQAINIYTTEFYKEMNGLMRDERHRLDYRTADHHTIRKALIHSVMAASGLRKAPKTDIPISYRGVEYDSDAEQQKRIETVAKLGVMQLNGFVSTSTEPGSIYLEKNLHMNFSHLRGAYIAPISDYGHENEYLIPQTQIQLTGYRFENGHHIFDATLVSELGNTKKTSFEPISIPVNTKPLQYANPEQVISLINRGALSPSQAREAFPEHPEIRLAAEAIETKALEHASTTLTAEQESSSLESTALGNPRANMDQSILKINLAFQRSGQPHEGLIKQLVISACKTKDNHLEPYSQTTDDANYLVHVIKEDPELCKAFGIDPSKLEAQMILDIHDLMKRAIEDKPLFSDHYSDTHSAKKNS